MNVSAPQRVVVLGSTGSVGAHTLDVIQRHPGRFEAFALSAQRRVDELAEQCRVHRPRYAVVPTDATAQVLRERLSGTGVRTEVL
ncbi:MAG: 1-deoxy-D-xylulose-5-phosphate reductoisomerase, partial [Rubrivivax sp.]